MEVQTKFFRRLLVGNSPQIFPGINRNVENPNNYPLLVQEIEKIKTDPGQASMIAEVIDASEGDMFRDFDLSTFMEHFKLDAFAKTLLASAFTHVSKSDLKTKGIKPSSLLIRFTDISKRESYLLVFVITYSQVSQTPTMKHPTSPHHYSACAHSGS